MRHPVVFGKYLLLERISVGGMAEVFKAKSFGEEGFEKILAIKRILPSMAEDEEFIEMFIDEAKISGQLSHPNVGQIYELGQIDGSHFIAMEFVWGKDVLQIQNRFRRLRQKMPLPMAAYIACRVSEGLDYAHRKKDAQQRPLLIIHRDVSPQNVLVSYAGEVKLIDFGIAKARSRSSKTQAGVLKGKFGYMSPEQVRGLPVDQRSDVFAVGTLLYEMATGERLFTGESDFATLEKVRNSLVPVPSKVDPRIPPALEAIILRALHRDPEDRYQWASEIHEELAAFLLSHDMMFTAKTLASTVSTMFDAERRREEAALEQYKKVRMEDAAKSGTATSPRREAVSLLHPGPMRGGAARFAPPESSADEMDDGATQIGAPVFDAVAQPEQLLSEAELVEIVEPSDPDADEKGTQVFADGASSTVDHAPPGEIASEPTFIFMAESGKLVQFAEESTVIFPQGKDNGGHARGDLPDQGPTVIFDVGLSNAVISGPVVPTADQITGTAPVAIGERPSVAKDVLIGVLVALLIIFGVVLWRILRTERQKTPAVATLILTATPPRPAEVFLNGARRGTMNPGMPFTVDGLAPREYRVTLRSPGAPPVEHVVSLGPGEVRVLTAEIQVPRDAGYLMLRTVPPRARVFLDGVEVTARAAGEPLEVTAGSSHEVRVSMEGYADEVLRLELKPGDRMKRSVTLQKERSKSSGRLIVNSDPPGAEVSVDGTRRGRTPLTLAGISPGRYQVTVSLAGYVSQSARVEVRAKQSLERSFRLARVEASKSATDKARGGPATAAKKGGEGPTDKKTADKQAADKQAADKKATDKKTADKKTADKKTADKKAADKKATDKKATDKKATDKQAADKKIAEKAADGRPENRAGEKDKGNGAGAKEPGYLVASTVPWSKVYVDGEYTGKNTPVAPRSKIPIKPGRHKISFEVEGKQFHFTVTIAAGQITRLIKRLPVE